MFGGVEIGVKKQADAATAIAINTGFTLISNASESAIPIGIINAAVAVLTLLT